MTRQAKKGKAKDGRPKKLVNQQKKKRSENFLAKGVRLCTDCNFDLIIYALDRDNGRTSILISNPEWKPTYEDMVGD